MKVTVDIPDAIPCIDGKTYNVREMIESWNAFQKQISGGKYPATSLEDYIVENVKLVVYLLPGAQQQMQQQMQGGPQG